MELGEYLLKIRTERGYSLRDLAEMADVSAAEISRIEGGKRRNPSPSVLRALSGALVVSYPYLMQLAGYLEDGAGEDDPAAKALVFRNENTGRTVDAATGSRRMIERDAAWANTAYRVSEELSEKDRRILNDMALAYLKRMMKENDGKTE